MSGLLPAYWWSSSRLVALAGDWHGNTRWAASCVHAIGSAGIDTVLHLGDFGLWPGPGGEAYLRDMEAVCAGSKVTLLVTPGNHEDWGRLDALAPIDRGDGLGPVHWLSEHIAFLPRGHRFALRAPGCPERSVVSLGGAPSIDFEHRAEGRSWWPSEQIPVEVAQQVADAGPADIMVAHDSPDAPYWTPSVARICLNGGGWSLRARAYAALGRERIHTAFEGVRPRVFAHGHYHAASLKVAQVGGHDCLMLSLDCDGVDNNVAVLDLATLDLAGSHAPIPGPAPATLLP